MDKGNTGSKANISLIVGLIAIVSFFILPTSIGLILLPILSIVGFILALSTKEKSSAKTIAIILNGLGLMISLLLYVVPFIRK